MARRICSIWTGGISEDSDRCDQEERMSEMIEFKAKETGGRWQLPCSGKFSKASQRWSMSASLESLACTMTAAGEEDMDLMAVANSSWWASLRVSLGTRINLLLEKSAEASTRSGGPRSTSRMVPLPQ